MGIRNRRVEPDSPQYRVLPAQTGGVQSESARVLVKADLGAQGACRRDSGLDVLA